MSCPLPTPDDGERLKEQLLLGLGPHMAEQRANFSSRFELISLRGVCLYETARREVLGFVVHWGVLGITLMYTVEGVAIPWPIEIPLWLSGDLLHHGQASYWLLVLVTWFGSSLGNLIAFVIACLGGRPLLLAVSKRFHLQSQVHQAQRWVDRYGLGAVIFTRWIACRATYTGRSTPTTGVRASPPHKSVTG